MPIRTIIATAALLLSPFAVVAQQPAAQPAVAQGLVAVAPGQFAGIVEARVTLAVEAIDQAGRTIVLKDTKGEQSKVIAANSHTVEAGRIRMSHLGRSGFLASRDSTACMATLATVTPFS